MAAIAWMAMFASWILNALSHNWAMVAIVATVASLLVIPWVILRKYIRISLGIMRSTRPPLSRSPLDFEPLAGEAVRFEAADGLVLSGTWIPSGGTARPLGVVIFAHEFCSDMRSCGRYCRPLQDAGYDIFAFDFRNHGRSQSQVGYTPRQWVSDREVDDMRGAIRFVEQRLGRAGQDPRVAIFGISRGACAGILAAVEHESVRGIISDGAFSTDRTIEYFMKRWAYIFARVRVVYENHHPLFWVFMRRCLMHFACREFGCNFPSVRKAISRMSPRALLFIHGQKDSYLPVEQSRLLYALAPQPKELWVAPGARHNQAAILHPGPYADLTTRFLNRYLAEAATSRALEFSTPPSAPAEMAGLELARSA